MRRYCCVLLLALVSLSVRADWIEQSNRYALDVLSRLAALSPEEVSSYGLSKFDPDVIDLGPDIYRRELALNRELIAGLTATLDGEKNPRVREDLQIMIGALQDQVATYELEHQYLLPYVDLHAFLFFSFRSLLHPRNDRARFPAALERLKKYTGQAPGHTPVTEEAMALTRTRLDVEGLLGPYQRELENNLEDAPRYVAGIRELLEQSGLDGWQADFALLERQLAAYTDWVRDTVLPRARSDNRLPGPLYINSLRNYGVTDDPRTLIADGQYSYQLIRSQMKALARGIAEQRGWEERDLLSVIRRLKKEQVPQDQLLEVYRKRLGAIEDIIRREKLVTLPQRDAVIRMATEAEAASIPASFMNPPQLIENTGQYGEFVLVQSNPSMGEDAAMDDWSHDSIIWGLTVHEARPGHELQFARLVEDGTSLARAIFANNSANTEGWGLYAESIMQPYLPPEGQLFSLYMRLLRAARMFLDPMVNTGRMTRDRAETFLVEQLALSRAMAGSEADRYAFRLPGQATSYYFGYIRLLRLRTEAEIAQGEAFDRQAFHDFILHQGLLPPDLMRRAVLEQLVTPAPGSASTAASPP